MSPHNLKQERIDDDIITPDKLETIVLCPASATLTSLPSTNWKWAKGASAVARIAFLISSFGLALLYLVACTCRKSSFTDLDLPSKGLKRMSTTLTYLNRWVVTSFANFIALCVCVRHVGSGWGLSVAAEYQMWHLRVLSHWIANKYATKSLK